MIGGSIGKIGNMYTLTVRLFSIETGEIVKTVSKIYEGKKEGLLTSIEEVAKEICGITVKKSKKGLWITTVMVVGIGIAAAVYFLAPAESDNTIGNPPDFPNM